MVRALGILWKRRRSSPETKSTSQRAKTCLHTRQIEQTLLQVMAGFEDEELLEVDNECSKEEKEDGGSRSRKRCAREK